MLITRESIVGRDFMGPGKHLRDATQVAFWPDVQNAEEHERGRAFGGFSWELCQQLKQVYGGDVDKAYAVAKELILGAAVHDPTDIPNAVRWSFWVDAQRYPGDNNGKSKHYEALVAAATSRKIPIPTDSLNLNSPLRP
jgi:hypothetical protein